MLLENHTLFYRTSCPYCIKVLRFMESHGIATNMADTTIPENVARLVEIGGKRQVPCLVINGQALYESDDIVAYLAGKLA